VTAAYARPVKKAAAVVVVLAVAIVAGVWWLAFRRGPSVSVAATEIRAIEFHPYPEGPPQPGLRSGVPDRWHVPIHLVEAAIPSPLPGPLEQGISCDSGAEVVFRLTDGRNVTYGPCRLPASIDAFRATAFAAMNDYISKTPSAEAVGAGMLALAQADRFQRAPAGTTYDGPVDCRVDDPHGFDGHPVYLCAIALVGQEPTGHLWEWGTLVEGTLHTHRTDPTEIPTITGAWDPPWQPA
jgi:hypothetical protein